MVKLACVQEDLSVCERSSAGVGVLVLQYLSICVCGRPACEYSSM